MKTTRREFLGMLGFAVGTTAVFGVCGKLPGPKDPIKRPPGVLDEDDFLSKCMRCKQCMYICATDPEAANVLFPAKMGDGFNVVNTPVMDESLNVCAACGKCAEVCPSGAIGKDVVPFFLPTVCVGCFKCIPSCPKNALSEGENGFPKVDPDLCVACGKCKDACEKDGNASVVAIEMRHLKDCEDMPDSNPNSLIPQFLADSCVGCFKCVPACPEIALTEGANGFPAVDPDKCIGCGDCVTECQANGTPLNKETFGVTLVTRDKLVELPASNPNKKVAYIDPEGCIHCAKRICFKACTYGAISYDTNDKKSPCVVDPAKCTGCGDCVNSGRPCDDDVITLIDKA